MASEFNNYLKYANLQMASEALFNLRSAAPGSKFSGLITDQNSTFLTTGNTRTSKFTSVQADAFIQEGWQVVEHISNTSTGFSGTLFKGISGELVLSFRSTEFIDDAARDNQATNSMEIKEKGWAFGQISDMQAWVDSLYASQKITADKPLTVTGYSLDGHVVTAHSLSEGAPHDL